MILRPFLLDKGWVPVSDWHRQEKAWKFRYVAMADGKKSGKAPRDEMSEIYQAPVIQREPTGKQVSLGGKLALRVIAEGRPTPTYQWFLNGKKLSGATLDRYQINRVRRDNSGIYTCEVKNHAGRVTSRNAMVSILVDSVPNIVVTPSAATIPMGQAFKFSITSIEPEKLKKLAIQWTFNGKRINGARGPTLEFTSVKKKYEGEYKAQLFIGGELRSSAKVMLTVAEAGSQAVVETAPVAAEALRPAPRMEDFFFNPEDEAADEPSVAAPVPEEVAEELDAQDVPVVSLERARDQATLKKKKTFLEKMLAGVQSRRADRRAA